MSAIEDMTDIKERLVRIETLLNASAAENSRRLAEHGERLTHIENKRLPIMERSVWRGSGAAVAIVALWELVKFNFKK